MDRGIVARVRDWDSRPCSGGYAGLRELSDAEFTGAVEGGGTWLFMLNGRAIGVFEGDLSGFESGGGTAYEAPHPALPLLFSMQSQGGETRARYYTDDTPLSEVDTTLSEAGFTGYLELSENVLSGDYYVVYYGGRSMSAAFIGNAGRVVTGDEAFALANDEVGIYEVRTVDVEVIDLPEPSTSAASSPPEPDDSAGDAATEQEEPVDAQAADAPEGEDAPAEPDQPATEDEAPPAAPDPTPEPEPVEAEDPPGPAAAEPEPPQPEPAAQSPADRGTAKPSPSPAESDPFSEEAEWRETRTIPALDPEESEAERAAEPAPTRRQPAPRREQPQPSTEPDRPDVESRIQALESALDARGEEIEHLRDRVESVSAERDQLREERDEFERQLDVADAPSASPAAPGPDGTDLDPETAILQTDLFVRYGSKGGATLEKAHDGNAERSAVRENLQLEHHTRFEAEGATVGGRPFEPFLTETIGYRFVEWVVETLFYEILDTDNRRALADLYDAIPRIDRAEFHGEVTATNEEEEETRQHTFDVVCRDRMGKPLLVADINDVRDPATGEMTTTLVEGATDIAEGFDSLAAAFLVTSSFFEPDALEVTAQATGGGLLARDRRKSFVKLSRKSGYHLCLVEARGSAFHVAVPEL